MSNLRDRVENKTKIALKSGDALYFESQNELFNFEGVDFQLTICPALLKKPTNPPPGVSEETIDSRVKRQRNQSSDSTSQKDVFAPPYNENLFVQQVGDSHVLLLNKYMVKLNHFLLATKDFVPQTSPLMPSDLVLARNIILEYKKTGQSLLSFFNCGEKSGASQPHKHIQFVPLSDPLPIEKLANGVQMENESNFFSLEKLPFANFGVKLSTLLNAPTEEDVECELANRFMTLLDAQADTYRRLDQAPPSPPFSYNVLMTHDHLFIIPRSKESVSIEAANGLEGWNKSLNSLDYAGLMLLRRPEEKLGISNPLDILLQASFPRVSLPEPVYQVDTQVLD
ncbi:5',5'''-P-1,P-4-tetraphosphate phosphorylase 2 [Wallemia ichthyophaga EXF-994]|uniref:5',5'''-P-1,P-4-tetraphosphate phosphorylase 2 n=1 Tax=Wallemia ichthyophaga (strain EXF-994 / CBS 113033) TaxID=1299270 RepID=R9ABR1_WALI9|nr:5',5'''-P-1,P-4-tetraphosphate phosphorylase 2 [Wallemia ichthyophaga EXF-994]EOQ99601.1 5',5'''-P-1,P-4-tetraphosphate phosphorylase 2 [Wallemia ichthyophaga EXF-994]TIB35633.1 hypothetical protein E3P84_01287 [Wallemia ichthyophaga]